MEVTGLKLTSFNCSGFKNRNYEYLHDVYSKCDILFLQETWLYDFQHSIIESVCVDSNYHAISAMDEGNIGQVGRPYGGCAIVWHRHLGVACHPVKTSSTRLCAVTVDAGVHKLLCVSVYMPNDDNSNASHNIYGEVLCELSTLISIYDNYNLIIGGDFNVDLRRPSRNLDLFTHFTNQEKLINVPSKELIYTFESSIGSRSKIDHFLISESVNYQDCYADVLNDALNLSQHLPLCFSTNLVPQMVTLTNTKVEKFILDWEKATSYHLNNYRSLLDQYLSDMNICEADFFFCNNFVCDKHDLNIMQFLDDLVNVMNECAWLSIPRKRINGPTSIPGWNDEVQVYKEKSLFWHQIWKSAGSPTTGQLADLRRFARTKYHWAIKQVKKNKNDTVKEKTAISLANKSFKDFWKEIKKLNKVPNSSSCIVDGLCEDKQISNRFKSIYKELYNSVNDQELNDTVLNVNKMVRERCNVGLCTSGFCHNTNANLVKEAVKELNKNKKDEIYGISSSHVIYGSNMLYDILSMSFTAMIKHGCCNEKFYKSVIKPIPKNKHKSKCDSSNYRAISLNSVLSKILDYMIIKILDNKIMTSEYQFAYKSDFSTSLCTFIVAETIQYYRNQGSNVYALLIDATKAFDRVQYSKIFNLLLQRNICPLIVRLLANMYLINSAVVDWNGTISESFEIGNGVKQGGVLSPILFAIYMDPLIKKLNDSNVGCRMGHLNANCFVYADDVILLSPMLLSMKKLINICEQYGNEYNLTFNPDKCYLLIFSDTNCVNFANINVMICGSRVKVVVNEQHLGHTLSSRGSIIDFSSILNDMKVRTNIIKTQFTAVSHKSKINLFNSQCLHLYGVQLWNLDEKTIEELCVTWRKCIRYIFGLHYRTKSYVIPHIVGTNNLIDIIMERQLCFYISGYNHPSKTISEFFKNTFLSNTSYAVLNLNKIMNRYNIVYKDCFNYTKSKVKKIISQKRETEDWRINIINELLSILDNRLLSPLDIQETKDILEYVCINE